MLPQDSGLSGRPKGTARPSLFLWPVFGQGLHRLLPALPESWKNGEVKGLKARGGFTVDIKWKDGKLQFAKVQSLNNKNVNILYNDNNLVLGFKKGEVKRIEF